jgi:hypothetical protein
MPSYYVVLEKKLPNLDVYVNGNALAKESAALEGLAKEIGVTSLLNFFSVSPVEVNSMLENHGETSKSLGIKPRAEEWFSAVDGLSTLRELINHLETRQPACSNQVLSNLQEFERVLEAASQGNVRWHLAVDY